MVSVDVRHLKNRLYYSQNREDLILRAFFPKIKKGFYVDVGGYDPDVDSVTKLFYQLGWSGINIEPQPNRFVLFQDKRKRDINLNVGVSNTSAKLTLRSYANQGLSTFSETMKREHNEQPDENTAQYSDIEVDVVTLKSIFKKYEVKEIDFMKIDVEGMECEVIEGNDWELYRPKVLCIEANHIKRDWSDHLTRADYKLVFNDGLNDYYVDSRTDLGDVFDYVQYVVVERGGGIRFEDYSLIKGFQEDNAQLRQVIHDADKELRRKNDTILALLENQKSIKNVSKQLLRLIKNEITRK